jgi:dTDP-4-dehydrorhamnose reductase
MAKTNKRVLVTGAAGILGHKVLEACPEGWEMKGVDIEDFDITSSKDCRSALESHAPRLLINCAAFTDVDRCETEYETAYRVNAIGAGNLARAASEQGAEIIHVSTDYVFDGEKREPYYEDDPVCPMSAYGRTKLAGETFVRANNPRHWIVRTQWLYGHHGKNFVDTILNAARTRPKLEVVDDQIGCPTYAKDLAEQMVRIAELGPPYGIYHGSNEGDCSWYDFAKRIVEGGGLGHVQVDPITSDKLTRAARRPAHSVLRNFHLEMTIGNSMRPWEEALADYLGTLDQ